MYVDTTVLNERPIDSYNQSSTDLSVLYADNTPYMYMVDDRSSPIDELEELKKKVNELMGKPYYMKITCHNCGAPLTIDSTNHLVKCKYCKTAYFSGTQLVNAV